MRNQPYQSGHLALIQGVDDSAGILDKLKSAEWDEGLVGFSMGVARWSQVLPAQHQDIAGLLANKIPKSNEREGYLMEAHVWRRDKDGGMAEELALEREADRFFFQKWTFRDTPPEGEPPNCFWAPAVCLKRKYGPAAVPGKFNCLEIIWWKYRIHVFMTIGEVRE